MLPEIALSNQFSNRFKDFFGTEPAIWNSKTTKKNKQYCSPSLKPGTRHKTCFNKKGLSKIARAWNKKKLHYFKDILCIVAHLRSNNDIYIYYTYNYIDINDDYI